MSDVAVSAAPRRIGLRQARQRYARYTGVALLGALVVFAVLWILFIADNAAIHQPKLFWQQTLIGITDAAVYFVVASGFTLIFGLMRVVNMAHGSFFLLGAYIAYKVQESWGNWGIGLAISVLGVAAAGLLMQQLFLRWNQGQELRQALITIAVSVIIADQLIKFFASAGTAPTRSLTWPDPLVFPVNIGVSFPFTRIFILICAVAIGVLLYLWLHQTRMGMVIRAGVDDRQMVSALGVNIEIVFALAFAVGSGLAAFGGVLGGSLSAVSPGVDGQYLLFALVVVIIGGLGSLGGAAVGAILLGLVKDYGAQYLPEDVRNSTFILVFALLVIVLAVRPHGLFGRPG